MYKLLNFLRKFIFDDFKDLTRSRNYESLKLDLSVDADHEYIMNIYMNAYMNEYYIYK